MTGLRKEIAKHVVLNILETLSEDDFVTVLTFSNETKPLVECFTDSNEDSRFESVKQSGNPELVQASTKNIAEFMEAMNKIETTENDANISSALSPAFELLWDYRLRKVFNQQEPICVSSILINPYIDYSGAITLFLSLVQRQLRRSCW